LSRAARKPNIDLERASEKKGRRSTEEFKTFEVVKVLPASLAFVPFGLWSEKAAWQ
jgi:hypothetical protein